MSTDRWQQYYCSANNRPASENLTAALAAFERPPLNGVAIDLGCGAGNDVYALLSRGWRVVAVDSNPAVQHFFETSRFAPYLSELTVICDSFESAAWPKAHLINANLALPFCNPVHFPTVWGKISGSLLPGGRFAGNFFGPHDDWAGRPPMTFLSADQIRELLNGWNIELFEENEHDALTAAGVMKHWHIINVVASLL